MIVFFVYNILIFNYKDTKNYRDYQLFKRISYPELRLKMIDMDKKEQMQLKLFLNCICCNNYYCWINHFQHGIISIIPYSSSMVFSSS